MASQPTCAFAATQDDGHRLAGQSQPGVATPSGDLAVARRPR